MNEEKYIDNKETIIFEDDNQSIDTEAMTEEEYNELAIKLLETNETNTKENLLNLTKYSRLRLNYIADNYYKFVGSKDFPVTLIEKQNYVNYINSKAEAVEERVKNDINIEKFKTEDDNYLGKVQTLNAIDKSIEETVLQEVVYPEEYGLSKFPLQQDLSFEEFTKRVFVKSPSASDIENAKLLYELFLKKTKAYK